jgi:hypothetical protein
MNYENISDWTLGQNKPNSNPISNPVKIFLNLPEILNQIERITSQLAKLGAWVSIITMLIFRELFLNRQYECDGKAMPESSLFEKSTLRYQPKPAPYFNPDNIIITNDGRVRFPFKLRIEVYRHLVDTIKEFQPQLHISLCMEEDQTFKALNMENAIGGCNCVF